MANRRPWGYGSLYRRGQYWWMAYRDLDGKRKQRSTYCMDREKAAEILNNLTEEIRTERRASASTKLKKRLDHCRILLMACQSHVKDESLIRQIKDEINRAVA